MLIRPELIEAVAETLEGLAITAPKATSQGAIGEGSAVRSEASILLFHPRERGESKPTAETPLLEINFFETDERAMIIVHSALGMVEMHDIEEVRILDATREVAIFSRVQAMGKIDMLTISAQGVLQVYSNIARELEGRDLESLPEEDLRAAVALKVFTGGAKVFTSTETAA